MSAWKPSPKTWPRGGPHPGRMHITLYQNDREENRLAVILSMDQALAIAVGDAEAGGALLHAIEMKVKALETGEASK